MIGYGGGLLVDYDSMLIISNSPLNNNFNNVGSVTSTCGGMFIHFATSELFNVTFFNNTAGYGTALSAGKCPEFDSPNTQTAF